jgi:hypothetical protein
VISKAVEALSDYGWMAVLLWAILGLAFAGLALIGFLGLGFAGTAMPSTLYWASWISIMSFLAYMFVTVRICAAFLRQRSKKRV